MTAASVSMKPSVAASRLRLWTGSLQKDCGTTVFTFRGICRHHRTGDRVRRLYLHTTEKLRYCGRGLATKRIHDRVDRQEPQHAHLGDKCGRSVGLMGSDSIIFTASMLGT